MRQDRNKADSFDTWQNLVTSVAANATDLAHLEVPRVKLDGLLKDGKDLTATQAALTASKQDVSKRIEDLVVNGRKLATVLKVAVREHYGARSEKLAEFRLQPFRGRKVKAPAPSPESAPPPAVVTPKP
jgi:hypothetical protein